MLKQFGIGSKVKMRTDSGVLMLDAVDGDNYIQPPDDDFAADLFGDEKDTQPVKKSGLDFLKRRE